MSRQPHPFSRKFVLFAGTGARDVPSAPDRTFKDDARDFVVAYLAGLVAFGVMLA